MFTSMMAGGGQVAVLVSVVRRCNSQRFRGVVLVRVRVRVRAPLLCRCWQVRGCVGVERGGGSCGASECAATCELHRLRLVSRHALTPLHSAGDPASAGGVGIPVGPVDYSAPAAVGDIVRGVELTSEVRMGEGGGVGVGMTLGRHHAPRCRPQIPELERFLLDPRLDVNARGPRGVSALHQAMNGEQIRLLLRHPRIDVQARDDAGRDALAYQVSVGQAASGMGCCTVHS